jgi:hypothetical protein
VEIDHLLTAVRSARRTLNLPRYRPPRDSRLPADSSACRQRVCVVEWMDESTNVVNDEFMAMLSAVQTAGHVPADPSYMRPLVASTR